MLYNASGRPKLKADRSGYQFALSDAANYGSFRSLKTRRVSTVLGAAQNYRDGFFGSSRAWEKLYERALRGKNRAAWVLIPKRSK